MKTPLPILLLIGSSSLLFASTTDSIMINVHDALCISCHRCATQEMPIQSISKHTNHMAIMIFGTNRTRAMGAVFAIFLAASVGAYNTNKWNFDTHPGPVVCINDKDCGLHGSCVSISKEEMGKKHCECHYPYVNEINGDQHLPCSYIGLASTDMFYLSLFLGWFGVDWMVLGRGENLSYICIGIAKLLSFGGMGIWWMTDWVRIWEGNFRDGNGMPLYTNPQN